MKSKNLVIKNSFFNVIYKGFTAVFPLITTSYIAKVLLPEGVGRVEYAFTIVSYFVTIASLGIPNYGIKAIAQAEKKEKSKVFFELLIINSISTFLCIFIYYYFIFHVGYFHDRIILFCTVGLMLFLNLFNIEWFLQGVEEYSYIAIRGMIIKILSFIAMVIFVKRQDDYINYAFILCMGTAGNYILNIFRLNKYITIEKTKLDLKKHLVPVIILFASTIATQIYTMLDSTMLEYIHGEVYVGYYSTAVKIVRMVYTVSIAMVAPLYPRISTYIKEKKKNELNFLLSKGLKIIIIVSFPAVIGLFCMSDWIIYVLFGNAFMPSAITLKILSPLVIIFSFAYFLGHIILMSLNKEKLILYSAILGAIINVLLNIVLIPRFQQNGAAISSLVAEIVVTIFVVITSKDQYNLEIKNSFLISMIISLVVLFFVICVLKSILVMNLFGLLIVCIMSAIIYFVMLLITKNDEVYEFYNFMKRIKL